MGYDKKLVEQLEQKAVLLRENLIKMLKPGKIGHLGGSSSIMDMVTALYFHKMNTNAKDPKDPNRDYFLISKGHTVLAQYAALAEAEYFSKDNFSTLKELGGLLEGHPDVKTPGIEAVTGSLGQGLSVGCGIAYGLKYFKKAPNQVYVVCGDGELAEGQIWEAAMFASAYKLDNLTMILDQNDLQAMGPTKEIFKIGNFVEKWASFGWDTVEIDGHNMEEILTALDKPFANKPKAIISHSIKGKGFSFAENVVSFHNGAMTEEQHKKAVEEIEEAKRRYM